MRTDGAFPTQKKNRWDIYAYFSSELSTTVGKISMMKKKKISFIYLSSNRIY
jgi:hypothetical protein